MSIENAIRENVKKRIKCIKTVGIIVSVLMVILGIFTFINPFSAQTLYLWFLGFGLLVYSIDEIVTFFASPKEYRDGFSLAFGIIWAILSLCFLFRAFDGEAVLGTVAAFDFIIGAMIGFTCIFRGITNFCNTGIAEQLGTTKAWLIVSGILYILAGISLASSPLLTGLVITVFYGLFLTIGGIALFCRAISIKTK